MASALIASVIAMTPVHGQEVELSPEAAVAHFLERQATASWQPFELFDDCAVQGAWENRAFELLASAQLSFDELSALAIAWQGVLTACGEPRLESWYFDQIEAGIAAGVPAGNFSTLWRALEGADPPRVRSFLLEITTDESIPPEYRDAAVQGTSSAWTMRS